MVAAFVLVVPASVPTCLRNSKQEDTKASWADRVTNCGMYSSPRGSVVIGASLLVGDSILHQDESEFNVLKMHTRHVRSDRCGNDDGE